MKADSSLQSERKRVTVMFADISGSTELVERLDPEEVISDLLPTVDVMAQVVQQFGGTVLKAMGDGIMAIFGAPIALEHHADRACYAALEIQRLVEAQCETGAGNSHSTVRVHVGLATGEVVAGILGEEASAAYDAAGFTIHLASRLQAMAPAGATYISRATYKLVRDQFECEHLGPMRIRGSTDPVDVYFLKAQRQNDRLRSREESHRERTPLVGRDSELAELIGAAERLTQGCGGIISIVGDPGVGKSRLVSEFRERVAQLPVNWLEGASLSYGRTLAYWPFLELLRGISGLSENDDEVESWRKLEARIVELFGADTADVLPYIATLLRLRVRGDLEERVKFLDGEAIRRQVFRSMRLLFERLAQRKPTIVLLEDAFWMDHSSAALLAHLVPLIESSPLLVCLVTRGERDGSESPIRANAARNHQQYYREILLKPLPPSDTRALVDHLLQKSNLSLKIRKAVCAASDGNPLFAEELVQSLLNGDTELPHLAIGASPGISAGTARFELPGSIESVIMSRVDQLEEVAKDILKTASVVGRTFFVRVLAAVAGSEETTQNGLVRLKRADLILDRRREPEPECMFKHVLVQEATYNSILMKRRRDIHARVGAVIEQLFGDKLDDLSGLLAHHYARAEQWEKAQFYLMKAGDQADHLAADEEALAHFQTASEAYMRAFGREASPIWKATLARKIGEAYYRKGDSEEAKERFREALSLLGSRDPRSTAGLIVQIVHQIIVQLWHRVLPVEIFDRRLGAATLADEERVRIYIMQWWLNFFQSPHRTLLYSLKTLNEAERSGAIVGIVHSCSTLGFICSVLGAPRMAEGYHARASLRAQDSRNPVVFGHAALGWGWHGSYAGHWADALEFFRQSAEASRGAGDLRQWGSATWGMILVFCHLGRFAEAWPLASELFEISEASGDQVNLRWSCVAKGMVLLRIAAFEPADRQLEAAMQEGRSASDWQIYTKSACELARSSLLQDNLPKAMALVDEAVYTVRKHGLKGHHVTELRNVRAALLLARLGRAPSGAAAAVLRWRLRWACFQAIRGGRVFRGSLPEALRLRGQYAWRFETPEAARTWWQGSRELCEQLGATYDLALTEIEHGRCLRDPARLARGEAALLQIRQGIPTSALN